MSAAVRRIAVYHPSTQHSLLLARALAQEGYDTSLITRFETQSAMRSSNAARLAYRLLGHSNAMRRAIENRSVGDIRSFSTDPFGILLGRLIGEALGHRALLRFDRSRMRHSAKSASKLIQQRLRPELVIAAETGALELLAQVEGSLPVVIDVAHPHPKEVDRCRRLAVARYPDFLTSWDDPPLEASGWHRLDEALTRATGVWTASRYTAESIRRFVDSRLNIDVVGYGVTGTPREVPGSSYKGRYLFIGAVGLRKGVPLLLEAWTRSGLADEGCTLDLVGRSLNSQVEVTLLRTAGVRRHVDVSSQLLGNLLEQADALVSPSYCEGFGRVLIEAASIGLPFLATKTGATDDILGCGLNKWSVEIDDLEGFTDMLQRFHQDGSFRTGFSEATLGIREHWSEKAYGSRLRSAIHKQLAST